MTARAVRLTPRQCDAAACGLFLLLALPLVGPALLAGGVLLPAHYIEGFFPWRADLPAWTPPSWNALLADSVLQYLPWRHFAHESLRAGTLPLWNPHQFCGTPFLANYQSALFYPPNVLFWALPAARAFGVSALVHLFLAGALLYLYLRGRGVGHFGAALGGAAWELSAFVTAWLELPTAVNVMVWLPLAWHLYERARAGSGPWRGLPVTLPLAMILLAGHPQFAFYALLAFVGYVAARPAGPHPADPSDAANRTSRKAPRLAGTLLCAGLPLLLAGILAAPQILPMLELSRLSHRAGGPLLAPDAGAFRAQALPLATAVVLLLPEFFVSAAGGLRAWPANYAEFAGSIGVVPTLLAAALLLGLALPAWRRRLLGALPEGAGRPVAFFAALAAAALLASFRNPVGDALHAVVPGLGRFGSPGRMLALFSLAGAALAGFGAHALAERDAQAVRSRAAAAAAALLALLAGAGIAAARARYGFEGLQGPGGDLARFLLLLGLAGGVAAFGNTRRLPGAVAQAALLALLAADLLLVAAGTLPTAPAAAAYPPSPLLTELRSREPGARVLALSPRWSIADFPPAVLPPNAATFYGLNDVNGYDSLYLLSYKRFLNSLAGRETSPRENGNMVLFDAYGAPGFRLLGCRYILSLRALSAPGLRLVADGPVRLYRYDDAYPRAYLSASPEGAPAPGWSAEAVEETPTRLTLEVRRAGERGPEAKGSEGDAGHRVPISRLPSPPILHHLVLLDSFMPGWRAEVDGSRAVIVRVHGTFRAVALPAGARRVVFRYEPAAFRFGLFLALAALAGVAGVAAFGAVQKKAAPAEASAAEINQGMISS